MLAISLCAGPAAANGTWSWRDASAIAVEIAPPRPAPMPIVARKLASSDTPDPVDACLRRAQASLQQRAFASALGWFEHAAALQPGLVLAHVGRAVSLLELDREFEAEDALADAYEVSGGPGETDLVLARLYALGGERGAALRQLGEAVQAAPMLADLARGDPAFHSMRDHPAFLMTLGDL